MPARLSPTTATKNVGAGRSAEGAAGCEAGREGDLSYCRIAHICHISRAPGPPRGVWAAAPNGCGRAAGGAHGEARTAIRRNRKMHFAPRPELASTPARTKSGRASPKAQKGRGKNRRKSRARRRHGADPKPFRRSRASFRNFTPKRAAVAEADAAGFERDRGETAGEDRQRQQPQQLRPVGRARDLCCAGGRRAKIPSHR